MLGRMVDMGKNAIKDFAEKRFGHNSSLVQYLKAIRALGMEPEL